MGVRNQTDSQVQKWECVRASFTLFHTLSVESRNGVEIKFWQRSWIQPRCIPVAIWLVGGETAFCDCPSEAQSFCFVFPRSTFIVGYCQLSP